MCKIVQVIEDLICFVCVYTFYAHLEKCAKTLQAITNILTTNQ